MPLRLLSGAVASGFFVRRLRFLQLRRVERPSEGPWTAFDFLSMGSLDSFSKKVAPATRFTRPRPTR